MALTVDPANFLPAHSCDGGFLHSNEWAAFKRACGHEVVHIEGGEYFGNGIVHALPLVGEYLYFPRGPRGSVSPAAAALKERAFEKKMKWVRIEPETEEDLEAY